MIWQKEIILPPVSRGYHLITGHIVGQVEVWPETGLLNIFIQHTSAALAINENADPTVRGDFERFLNQLIPEDHPLYEHNDEGADDMPAHLKSSLLGQSLTIPVTNRRLNLGTWQGIYLCEFRHYGGSRKLVLTMYG